MKRVLSLVLAFVLVLGMVPAVNFAAVDSNIQQLVDLGIVRGTDEGLELDSTFTRAQLAVMLARMNNAEEAAANYQGTNPFPDMEDHWAANYVAYAANEGWVQGDDLGLYNPNGLVEGRHIIVTSLRVLGFEYEGAWNDAEITAAGAERGIAVATLDAVTRGQAFQNHYVTLFVAQNAQGVILAEQYNWVTPEVPVVTELEVINIFADNLKQVYVEFNQDVEGHEEVAKAANYTVANNTVEGVLVEGETVILNLKDAVPQQAVRKITVKDNILTEEYSEDVTFFDVVAPQVEGVRVYGNRKLVVTFSEPVDSTTSLILTNYRINDLMFGARITASASNPREVEIVLANRLPVGVHNLVVQPAVKDFAGFTVVANNTEFVVAEDTTKPEIVDFEGNQTQLKVTFSKPVEGNFKVNAGSAALLAEGGIVSSQNDTVYTLNFQSANPIPLSGADIVLEDVEDYYGNKDTLRFRFVPEIDLERPEVNELAAISQSQIQLTFTKNIDVESGTFEIKTVADEPVTIEVSAAYGQTSNNEDRKKVVLTRADGETFAPGEYTVSAKDARDLTPLKNVMVPYTNNVTVTDLTAPTVASATLKAPTTEAAGSIFIEFDKKVEAATALDKGNYSYTLANGTLVRLGDSHTIRLLADGKTVTISVPKLTPDTADNPGLQPVRVTITNVTDLAGNVVAPMIRDLTAFSVDPLVITNPRATAADKIQLTVPGNIDPNTVTPTDFVVRTKEEEPKRIFVINAEYDGKETITLTLNDRLSNNAKFDGTDVEVFVVARNLKDIYGNQVVFAENQTELNLGVVQDKIAPVALRVSSATYDATTTKAAITVLLSEKLDAPDVGMVSNIVLEVDGKLVHGFEVKYVDTNDEGEDIAPRLVFEFNDDSNLVGKSYSVKFFTNAAYQDQAENNLRSFDFTGTLRRSN